MASNPEQIPIHKRLLSAMFNFGLANVMTKLIGFLLIPLYTQYLSPEDYGIVELCASLGAFSIILMRLGVPGSVNRFYFDYKDDLKSLNNYVTTIHYLLIVASISVGLVIGIFCYFYSDKLLPGLLFFPFIMLTIINSGFSANSDLQKRLLQSQEKSAYMARLNISLALLGILLALLFVVVFKMGALGLILSQSCTTLLFFVQAQYYLRNYIKGKFSLPMLKSSLRYGSGLLPHHLFAVLTPLLSKGLLNSKESLAALGIFSLSVRFIQPLDIVHNVFNISFNPIYFSLRKNQENTQIVSVYKSAWFIGILLFSGTALLFPSVIPLVTPARFHQSAFLIPILALGFIGQIAYMLFLQETFYDKDTKYISIATFSGMAVNLIITLFTVEKFGVYSIAWASTGGFISNAIMGLILSNKHFLNYIEIKTLLVGILIVIIVFIPAAYLPIDAIGIRICIFFVSVITIMLINGRSLQKLTRILRLVNE